MRIIEHPMGPTNVNQKEICEGVPVRPLKYSDNPIQDIPSNKKYNFITLQTPIRPVPWWPLCLARCKVGRC